MDKIVQKRVKENKTLFQDNERQVNAIICKCMAVVFFIFPIMLLLNFAGIFKFSGNVVVGLTLVGSFCTVSPYILSKYLENQTFIKYYAMICVVILVSFLGTEYYVGIYITFILAPIMSCMYFDKAFTSKIIVLSYIGYLISYYFRCIATRDYLYPGESVWETYIPLAVGFTIEFIVCFVFLYNLAERTHFFLVEQRRLIEELEKNEAKIGLVMTASTDIIFEYDIEKDVYSSNGSIRGWERKDITLENFRKYIHDIDWINTSFPEALERLISLPEEEGNYQTLKLEINFREGEKEYQTWALYEIIILRNKEGVPITCLGKIRNITEEKLEELKLEESKHYDALTGMYHYASLRKIIQESESGESEKTHQIMIIHVKNYAEIGQCYGEVYRDFVIMNAAEEIKKAVSGTGAYTCRLSSDVFFVYLTDSESMDTRELRQKLNEGLKNLYVGEKNIDRLVYDFGYYLGEEELDELFTVALNYVDEQCQSSDILGEDSEQGNIRAVSGDQNLREIPENKRREVAEKFIDNISSLIMSAKDRESTIQIALSRVGKFFELDGVRIYPIRKTKGAVNVIYSWAVSDKIKQECDLISLNHEVIDFFVENFGKSRIVDNTIGAFQDFFRQFGENPLLVTGYSSLICPVISEDSCKAIIVYDVCETNHTWSDEWKEYLLTLSKLFGNSVLHILENYSMKERDTLLSHMSQEIRMPMNAIFELTEIAEMELDNPAHIEKCLDLIDASSKNILEVVNHILDLSKIELASQQEDNEIFSLEDILGEMEQQILDRTSSNAIDLVVERQFQENLLRGEASKIAGVLRYLVENAVHYTDEGGRIHVLVQELSKEDGMVELFFTVKDNGVVIAEDHLEQMIEILESGGHWNIEKESRIDLGLVIAYRFVEMMGGRLNIESSAEEGTRFTFKLRLAVPEKEKMMEFLSRKREYARKTVDLTEKNILLAEDDKMNAEIVKRLLEKHGAHVDIVGNGKQCVDLFQSSREGKYSLILMDIVMPIVNGHDAAKTIRSMDRQDAKSIPIIALSATAFERDRNASIEAGMNAHLVKPIHVEEVLMEMSKFLD